MRLENKYLYAVLVLTSGLSLLLYVFIGYYVERTETNTLLISYGSLFILFTIIMCLRITPLIILTLGVIFRLVLIINFIEQGKEDPLQKSERIGLAILMVQSI